MNRPFGILLPAANDAMKHTLIFLITLLLAPLASFAAPERPNVLFICTDQQHAGMLSCAGNRWLKTPAMDSIARTAPASTRAYCVNPVCVPSRTGMFTGYTPARLGIQVNGDKAKTRIPADIQQQAMGSLFRNAGYETAYGGKVHVVGGVAKCGFTATQSRLWRRRAPQRRVSPFSSKSTTKPFLLVASFVNPHDICYLEFGNSKARQVPRQKGDCRGRGLSKEAKANVAAALKRPDRDFG